MTLKLSYSCSSLSSPTRNVPCDICACPFKLALQGEIPKGFLYTQKRQLIIYQLEGTKKKTMILHKLFCLLQHVVKHEFQLTSWHTKIPHNCLAFPLVLIIRLNSLSCGEQGEEKTKKRKQTGQGLGSFSA